MELSGPFAGLAQGLVRLLVQAAGAVVMVVVSWQLVKVLLMGGSERAIRQLVVSLLVIGVAVAGLSNVGATVGIVASVGAAGWGAVAEAVRAAV
jgi:hypothetical protein